MFNIRIDDSNIVHLSGRFDASQEETAMEVLDKVETTCVVDFEHLEYISSSGLGVLLCVQKRLNEKNHELKLINLNPHIREVFSYAGFDQIFEIG